MNLSNHTTELLNIEKIQAAIETDQQDRLSLLEIFDTIDSTNTYLLTQAKKGAPSGSICFAEQQTNGRGRLRRSWFSPYGTNIYCSLLYRFKEKSNISGLSIAIGIMIIDALRKYGIVNGLQLKWPNDILFNKRKLGGILLECNDHRSIVIGIGLNLSWPNQTLLPDVANWITIQEITGCHVRRNYLAGLVVNELLARLPLYEAHGLHVYLADWQKYDVLKNKFITIHAPKENFYGVMKGVNEKGELILQSENGSVQCFCYGEVSVRE